MTLSHRTPGFTAEIAPVRAFTTSAGRQDSAGHPRTHLLHGDQLVPQFSRFGRVSACSGEDDCIGMFSGAECGSGPAQCYTRTYAGGYNLFCWCAR